MKAGQDLFKGAICILIDSSFYLTQAGDEKNTELYYCTEDIKEGETIKVVLQQQNLRMNNITMRGPVKLLYKK